MGIEDILRKKDERRGDPRQDAYEREFQARFIFSERVAGALVAALIALRDKAIGEAVRLPIAAKPSETPVLSWSSAERWECVVEAGWIARLRASPMLAT